MTEIINYKDSFVAVHHCKNLPMHLNPRKCYCCNKNIESDEQIALMVSNNEYIPNMFLHETCYKSFGNKENFIGNIEKDYREYKVKNEIFGNI